MVLRRALDRIPPGLPPQMFAQAATAGIRPKEMALTATNIGTMRGPFSVAGRKVSTLIGMSPLFVGRAHLTVGLFGLGSQVCAGFTASASVPRHAELADRWLAELAALGGPVPVRSAAAVLDHGRAGSSGEPGPATTRQAPASLSRHSTSRVPR